ncbi:MAG: hypothetical protein HYW37_00795 [Candidatus Colwellbacteria bacterium]|nr:hypothetical protein [Candidatus Colwellbacteria bacterium]
MIIFLYGQDSYRRLKKLNDIIKTYRERHGRLSEDRFDLGAEGEVSKLKEFMANRSLFDPAKLVVLDNISDCEDKSELKKVLKENLDSKDSTVIVSSDREPTADFKFLLKEPVKPQEFKALSGKALAVFIKNEAEEKNLALLAETTEYLIKAFEGDSWGIVTELDKLGLASGQTDKERKLGDNFYELLNKLKGSPRLEEKIVSLEMLLSGNKEDPARIFNSLSYYLTTKEAVTIFADYDVAVKSGKLDYEEALTEFALLS